MSLSDTIPAARVRQGTCPPHVWEEWRPIAEEMRPLLPRWIEEVLITFQPEELGTLESQTQEEYRYLILLIDAGVSKLAPEQRRRWVLHEYLHAHIEGLTDANRDLVHALDPPEPVRKLSKEQWRRALERTTNDLENVLWSLWEASHGRV